MIVVLLLLALNVIFVFVGLVDAFLYTQPTTHSLELPKDWLEREFEQLEATVRGREEAKRALAYSASSFNPRDMLYGGLPIELFHRQYTNQQADLQQMARRQQIDMNNLQFNLANQYNPLKAM